MADSPSCQRIQSQLWDYCTKSLSAQEAQPIGLHLSTCEACRHSLAECEQILAGVASIKATSLPTSQRTWEQLQQQILNTPARKRRLWNAPFSLFATVSMVTAVGAIALFVRLQLQKPIEVSHVPPSVKPSPLPALKSPVRPMPAVAQKPRQEKPLLLIKAKPKSGNRLQNALYKTQKRTHYKKPPLTLVSKPEQNLDGEGVDQRTVIAVKFAVDGEMPLVQTQHRFDQGTPRTEYRSLSSQTYLGSSSPNTSLISHSDTNKEMRPW